MAVCFAFHALHVESVLMGIVVQVPVLRYAWRYEPDASSFCWMSTPLGDLLGGHLMVFIRRIHVSWRFWSRGAAMAYTVVAGSTAGYMAYLASHGGWHVYIWLEWLRYGAQR